MEPVPEYIEVSLLVVIVLLVFMFPALVVHFFNELGEEDVPIFRHVWKYVRRTDSNGRFLSWDRECIHCGTSMPDSLDVHVSRPQVRRFSESKYFNKVK